MISSMKYSKLFVALLFSVSALYYVAAKVIPTEPPKGLIIEAASINSVFDYIKPDEYDKSTLVMFDIDNTLGRFSNDLGSDQWFYAMLESFKSQGLSQEKALEKLLPISFQIHYYSWMIPVEKDTVSVVNTLQKKGVSVIGLTARSLELTQRTIEQLDHMGIYFTKTDPHECPLKYGMEKPGLYIDGIIFSGRYNKGEMVYNWFKAIKYQPKKVIFIDDKLKNLESVEQALVKRNFPFIGIRYSHEDARVKSFNLSQTKDALEALLKTYPLPENAT